jgi:hypothetical protein
MEGELTILDLPPEILTNILHRLPVRDLLQAAQTCHGFQAAASVAYAHLHSSQIGNLTVFCILTQKTVFAQNVQLENYSRITFSV